MYVKHAMVLPTLISPSSRTGDVTSQFYNPNFDNNPNNGVLPLSSAQAQSSYKDSSHDDYGVETPLALDSPTQAIQPQILGGLPTNINIGKPEGVVINDFIIDTANRDGQPQLNVTDKEPGEISTTEASGLQVQSTDL